LGFTPSLLSEGPRLRPDIVPRCPTSLVFPAKYLESEVLPNETIGLMTLGFTTMAPKYYTATHMLNHRTHPTYQKRGKKTHAYETSMKSLSQTITFLQQDSGPDGITHSWCDTTSKQTHLISGITHVSHQKPHPNINLQHKVRFSKRMCI